MEDKGLQIGGLIAQTIGNLALSFALAMKCAGQLGPIGWAAFGIAGMAQLIAMIAQIKSLSSGYASGGIIPGNNYNDGLVANVSSGELILNRAQQGNLASQLSGTSGAGTSQPYLDVETIWLGIGHYLKRKGMGEIVTTR
jgi:hypothetical protein